MSERRFAVVALLMLLGAGAAASAEDNYPSDITPPPGTRYPCALTALPRGLPGIPEADRAFINHTYARVLSATQAKLVLLKALEARQETSAALARYEQDTQGLAARQKADVVPPGLEAFQDDVLAALALQQSFFAQATALREAGVAWTRRTGCPRAARPRRGSSRRGRGCRPAIRVGPARRATASITISALSTSSRRN